MNIKRNIKMKKKINLMKLTEKQVMGLCKMLIFYKEVKKKNKVDSIVSNGTKIRIESAITYIEDILKDHSFLVDPNEREYLNKLRELTLNWKNVTL